MSQDYMAHGSQGLFTQVGFNDHPKMMPPRAILVWPIPTPFNRRFLLIPVLVVNICHSLGPFQCNSSQVPDLQGLMNPLYSQPFAHYNTQPLNLQAPQQQQQQQQQTPPQQGQSSQNQKLHYNG
ncbi:hypothetical protein CK203_026672 [Vitis vinifera]|uniref:Uncharacterized protein n=1 Tax=Vitis vinifera TaxID=29760 RepID=A0A438IU61_VITVI|nr:hypothetical protein CK203_026672 [Vitis vinifera]